MVMKLSLWDRQITFNPCGGIDLPKALDLDEGELAVLTYVQAEVAASELANCRPYDVLVRFVAYTGLRAGEVAGPRVRAIHLRAGHASVRQTGQWIKRTDQEVGGVDLRNAQVAPHPATCRSWTDSCWRI
ncbi:hypothetical protein [Microbacterium testaceum]|nr:hypothetical protein [Microbacterium testaceum]